MGRLTEREFIKIVDGIVEDRVSIFKHNPVGTEEETLLWMLMSCLINYLGLSDQEIPCFPGTPTADTYRQAVEFIVAENRSEAFDLSAHLRKLK